MKRSQVKVGGFYIAEVEGEEMLVRLDKIRVVYPTTGKRIHATVFDVTNPSSGRAFTFKTARRFRAPASPGENGGGPKTQQQLKGLGEQLRQAVYIPGRPAPHVVVVARAGTGKTTTLVEGLKLVKGGTSPLTPSPQQAAVWAAMQLSASKARTVCFVAFNKSIATELQQRVPNGCDAMTMHSMGFKAVGRAFGKIKVNQYRVLDIIGDLLGVNTRDLRKSHPTLLNATKKLVGLCKMNLVGLSPIARDEEDLEKMTAHYDVDLNGERAAVFELVPRVLNRCKDVAADGCVDFDDMIWLPVALDLPVFTYDLLLVDEAQDLNRCQQQLALKAGRRLVLCGDPHQAIYGFAGADAESMPRMTTMLGDTPAGCVTLPLTVTYRCGKNIVAEAQALVPDFEAHESNCAGSIHQASIKEGPTCYRQQAMGGDMVLCRVNAPLVSECFKFIKAGIKANIQGRDIGQGLISTINKMKATSIVNLVVKLSDWLHKETAKENAKRNPNEARLIALDDRHDCLMCFADGAVSIQAVIGSISAVFTNDRAVPGIMLSSVHKAKGLEADRVFILEPEGAGMPHPMAKSKWQREQEMNLRYVAITRAAKTLVYVK